MQSFRLLSSLLLVAITIAAPAPQGSESVASSSSIASSSTFSSAPSNDPSSTVSAPSSTATVPYVTDAPNNPMWNENSAASSDVPQPIRGTLGSNIIAQENIPIQLQNPDILAPPTTDNGDVPNIKWPMSLSHNRLATGGWARQQNVNQMPIASAIAGVDMRLEAGAIREMHWHTTAEWGYVLEGEVRVSVFVPGGDIYVADVAPGDIWYFPPGFPHSIQATNKTSDGSEFLLVFDSGDFSEDNTFLLTDWLAHVPMEVIAKNFGVSEEAFEKVPSEQLYIFPSNPPPVNIKQDMVVPNDTPIPYTFSWSQMNATTAPGGKYKIADSRSFHAATTICAAEIEVEVGGMRELHWHPTEPEWTYYLSGTARVTAFAAQSNAQTFDFQAGDVGYIPPSYGHYIENTGNTTLKFLEIFKSGTFQDISLNQWLALTPHDLVKAHLGLSDETISKLSQTEQVIVGPNPNN